MYGRSADQIFFGRRQLGRIEYKGLRLVTAHPAMTTNQLFISRYFIRLGVVEAVHQDIRAVGKAIFANQVLG